MHGGVTGTDDLLISPALTFQDIICVRAVRVHNQLTGHSRRRWCDRCGWSHRLEVTLTDTGRQVAVLHSHASERTGCVLLRTGTTERLVVIAHHYVQELDRNNASVLFVGECADFNLATYPATRVNCARVNRLDADTVYATGLFVRVGGEIDRPVTRCNGVNLIRDRETFFILGENLVAVFEVRRELDTTLFRKFVVINVEFETKLFAHDLLDSIDQVVTTGRELQPELLDNTLT